MTRVNGPARPGLPLTSLGRDTLASLLAELGEPGYRADQVLRWLYQRCSRSFTEMTDVPEHLRSTLEAKHPIYVPREISRQESHLDATRRYVWELYDGATVESVGLPGAGSKLAVCFSTQAGCAMACAFCATGAGGYVRDLHPGEMAMQVALVGADYGRRVTSALAMGQGEPFAAYDATLAGLRLLNDDAALRIGARHLTVSTCGIASGINRLSTEPEQFTLAVSLHSAIQKTRDHLVPAMRRQPLPLLRAALEHYAHSTGRRLSIEYTLIRGINDADPELEALVEFCSGLRAHVNIIPFNPPRGSGLVRSTARRAHTFAETLTTAGIETSVRTERGADIGAACGQLSQAHSCLPRAGRSA